MKFAKKMQDERYSDWCEGYFDYKLMKKVLKRENEEAVYEFCSMLEAQLQKVHTFMQGQQKAISADILPLELNFGSTSLTDLTFPVSSSSSSIASPGLSGHCSKLVDHIEKFRDFATLNHMALRKIIKKFDKRFQMHFLQSIGLPTTTKLLVNDRDIHAWLLDPAQHILDLMRGMMTARNVSIERPLKQLDFWVSELKAGSQLARLRVSYGDLPDLARLRSLLLAGGEMVDNELMLGTAHLQIRNTFIDLSDTDRSFLPRRASSQPPRPAALKDSDASVTSHCPPNSPEASPQSSCAEELDVGASMHRSDSSGESPSSSFGTQGRGVDRRAPTNSGNHRGCRGVQATPPPPPEPLRGTRYGPIPDPLSGGSGRRHAQAYRRNTAPERAARDWPGPHGSSRQRWWTHLNDACPISGFPVRLLPYPPFKLQVRGGGSGKPTLSMIDGAYLVLQVLCTWRFEVLGCPLTSSEISSLDAYMRRCKLGPFRLGRALELLALGTEDARTELEALRSRAVRRLEVVRHVQRVRLERGDDEAPPEEMERQPSRRTKGGGGRGGGGGIGGPRRPCRQGAPP